MSRIARSLDFREKRGARGPFVASDGQAVGFAGGTKLSVDPSAFDIFYPIAKGPWGRGYGTEAASRLLRLAFEERSAQEVSADVAVVNVADRKTLERTRMRRTGLRPSSFENAEGKCDRYRHAISRADFFADL